MAREMLVEGRLIADHTDCFVIAEIGHNHQGDMDQAMRLFDAAAQAGADAVKLQKRDNRSLYTQAFYDKPYDGPTSFAPTYGEHREYLEFDATQYRDLKEYAEERDLVFFATAFDHPSADLLAGLDVPAFKIASGDLTNTPLLRHVASLGKPMFVSTGGGTLDDVERAHDVVRESNDQLCLLQCTAGYPPDWSELNLRVIETFREHFSETVVGFSAHDSGIAMALAGYCLGARVIEKHFTLNRAMKGTDHSFSLEPQGLGKMVRDLHRARLAMGDGKKVAYPSEEAPLLKMAKQLVASRTLDAGVVLTEADVIAKSPAGGLPPYRLGDLVGQVLLRPMQPDEPFSEDHVQRD